MNWKNLLSVILLLLGIWLMLPGCVVVAVFDVIEKANNAKGKP